MNAPMPLRQYPFDTVVGLPRPVDSWAILAGPHLEVDRPMLFDAYAPDGQAYVLSASQDARLLARMDSVMGQFVATHYPAMQAQKSNVLVARWGPLALDGDPVHLWVVLDDSRSGYEVVLAEELRLLALDQYRQFHMNLDCDDEAMEDDEELSEAFREVLMQLHPPFVSD